MKIFWTKSGIDVWNRNLCAFGWNGENSLSIVHSNDENLIGTIPFQFKNYIIFQSSIIDTKNSQFSQA